MGGKKRAGERNVGKRSVIVGWIVEIGFRKRGIRDVSKDAVEFAAECFELVIP